jgi:hypothetical protein
MREMCLLPVPKFGKVRDTALQARSSQKQINFRHVLEEVLEGPDSEKPPSSSDMPGFQRTNVLFVTDMYLCYDYECFNKAIFLSMGNFHGRSLESNRTPCNDDGC